MDVWRFSPTRQYLICHRSGRLGDRVGYEKLTAFLELERITHELALSALLGDDNH